MSRGGRSGWIDSSENVRPKYPRYLYPSDPMDEYGAFRVQASNNIEQVVPSPRNKLERKRKLVKKYRRLDDAEDQRELDNVVRVSVPRDKENLMDDISWYRNWVPTSLGSYEESLDMRRMQRRLDQTLARSLVTTDPGQEPWRPMPRHKQAVNRRNDNPGTGGGSRRRNNKDSNLMVGTLMSHKKKLQRQDKGKGRRNKFSRKQFGVKKSQENKKVSVGVKPPRPPHAPPPPVVTPLLDHMEAPGVRPVIHHNDDDETTKVTNSQQESTIEQNVKSEKVNTGDNHEEIKSNNAETTDSLVTSVYEEADEDENFDINIDNEHFSVNPVVTYDEREMVKEIQNSIQVDRLPGVGQLVTNDISDQSPLLPTRRPRRLTPRPLRNFVTTSPPPLPTSSPWRSGAVGGSHSINQGSRFSPTPLSSLTNLNKRKKLGSQYSSDVFDADIPESSLKRRLGPHIPIMTSRMDIDKEGTYNFE